VLYKTTSATLAFSGLQRQRQWLQKQQREQRELLQWRPKIPCCLASLAERSRMPANGREAAKRRPTPRKISQKKRAALTAHLLWLSDASFHSFLVTDLHRKEEEGESTVQMLLTSLTQ